MRPRGGGATKACGLHICFSALSCSRSQPCPFQQIVLTASLRYEQLCDNIHTQHLSVTNCLWYYTGMRSSWVNIYLSQRLSTCPSLQPGKPLCRNPRKNKGQRNRELWPWVNTDEGLSPQGSVLSRLGKRKRAGGGCVRLYACENQKDQNQFYKGKKETSMLKSKF